MSSIRKIKILFWSAVACLTVTASTILFMPLVTADNAQESSVLILGLMFWISALAGYILIGIANSERKWFLRRRMKIDPKMSCRPGVISFFTNVPATIADITAIASLIAVVVVNLTEYKYDYIAYVFLFLLVLSLNLRCLFNGRIYKVTKFKRVRRESSYE